MCECSGGTFSTVARSSCTVRAGETGNHEPVTWDGTEPHKVSPHFDLKLLLMLTLMINWISRQSRPLLMTTTVVVLAVAKMMLVSSQCTNSQRHPQPSEMWRTEVIDCVYIRSRFVQIKTVCDNRGRLNCLYNQWQAPRPIEVLPGISDPIKGWLGLSRCLYLKLTPLRLWNFMI